MQARVTRTNLMLIVVIAALLIYYFMYKAPKIGDADRYAKQKQEIDSLTQVIGGLEREQLVRDSIIKDFEIKVSVLDGEIDNQKGKISNLKKQYGTKIQNVGRYTPTELDSFFTDRYN